jgi:hypothetical protein
VTLAELIEEVYEKTHVDRLKIYSRATSAWPGRDFFTPTQCALLVRALRGATPSLPAALGQV